MPPETVQCVLRNLKLEAFLYCGKIWGMFQRKALKDSKVDFKGDLGDFRIIWECWHFYNGMELTGVFLFCFVFFFSISFPIRRFLPAVTFALLII